LLAADPLVQAHLNSKDEPGFSATLVNAAQRDVSGQKKALRAQIAELSREYPLIPGVPAADDLTPLAEIPAPKVDLSDLESLEQTLELIRQAGLI
jgi:hypothetical protein